MSVGRHPHEGLTMVGRESVTRVCVTVYPYDVRTTGS